MSDPRFAKVKTDPRFRKPRKQKNKVVVDERFKSIFEDKKGDKKAPARVDKYGRKVAQTKDRDDLRRFYRLEGEDDVPAEDEPVRPDLARGAVLMESSDEEDDNDDEAGASEAGSEYGGVVKLGRDTDDDDDDDDAEIDLDESQFADLDAQAAALSKAQVAADAEDDAAAEEAPRTRRLAVVNLDWDHVRAVHLYKIFSSLVSPTAPAAASASRHAVHEDRQKLLKGQPSTIARGRVLSVRVYPSEFGRERLEKEEREGPPVELFKKKKKELREEDIDERTIFETGDADEYDEDALRMYQLERLRYYYAIAECDTVDAASHIYHELDGSELERSANVFDLSFVPDDMTFDQECRDEAVGEPNGTYTAVEFVTDALRNSKVKFTWDDDDPERNRFTRRTLTRKEIEEADFRAYIASSSSSSGSEDEAEPSAPTKSAGRGKKKSNSSNLRALLLGEDNEELPEGWGGGDDDAFAGGDNDGASDVDMQVTFAPALSGGAGTADETTLDKYQRKMREKRKKRKEERGEKTALADGEKDKKKGKDKGKGGGEPGDEDEFFGASGSEDDDALGRSEEEETRPKSKSKKGLKGKSSDKDKKTKQPRQEATAEELALLAASDAAGGGPTHFDMKAILKAEKTKGKNRKDKKSKNKGRKGAVAADEDENELQETFAIDVKDQRFKAIHEDHHFAIDPSNPQYKKTKSMSALLDERSKRYKDGRNTSEHGPQTANESTSGAGKERDLKSLVESVKRKSAAAAARQGGGMGKRRKLE